MRNFKLNDESGQQEAKWIEKALKEYEKKIERMTLAEIYRDLENYSAERKKRKEMQGAGKRGGK